jgi:hypothetical protein
MKAATVVAGIGGVLAAVGGLLLIALGSLAGLAENPEGEATRTGGWIVLTLGALILTAVFVARRWPFVLAAPLVGRCYSPRQPSFCPSAPA